MTQSKKHIPEEFMVHLKPLKAQEIHVHSPQFIFMDAEMLEAELTTIEEALPPYLGFPRLATRGVDTQELATKLFYGMLPFLFAPPAAAELKPYLALLPEEEYEALRERLKWVRHWIRQATWYQGQDWEPTRTFAVPPDWRSRWDMLISGELLLAYVQALRIENPPD